MSILKALFFIFRGLFVNRRSLILENLALRHQLAVQQRTAKRPKLQNRDRFFWAWLSRIWPAWKSALIIVKPETVVKWNREGFRLYRRWKSRSKRVGRAKVKKEIRDLIRQMFRENPTWGAPRIQSELRLLGYEMADSTVFVLRVQQQIPNPPVA
ncbi:MAG: helix-turn-helix domain-containing protein [Planctomycetes bacterium]|nr:helix-turn-helix domain-containing protein [Planctomycetota bacterium]